MKHKMWVLSLIMAVIIGFYMPFPWWLKTILVFVFILCNQFIPILPEILAAAAFIYAFINAINMPWWAIVVFFALLAFYIVWCVLMYKEINRQTRDQN